MQDRPGKRIVDSMLIIDHDWVHETLGDLHDRKKYGVLAQDSLVA